MSSIADTFNGLGYLPLQHQGFVKQGWSIQTRDSILCVRTQGRERTGDNAGAYSEDPDARGDLNGAVCWPVPRSSKRKQAAWNFAFGSVITTGSGDKATTSGSSITYSKAGGGGPSLGADDYNVLPLRDEENKGDDRFSTLTIARPQGFPKLPLGTIGVVVGGMEEDRQIPRFLPCDGRLIAVNFAGDPEMGSLVCDLDKDGRLDPTRTAPLQSAFRVIKGPSGSIDFPGDNCIGLQLSQSGLQDSCALVFDAVAGNIAASLSKTLFGPIDVGGLFDQHQIGVDADGHPINSGHIALGAYFRSPGGNYDGPLKHDGDYLGAQDAPYRTHVTMEYDYSLPHAWLGSIGPVSPRGKHRWVGRAFQYVPDTPSVPTPKYPPPTPTPKKKKPPTDTPSGGPVDDPMHGGQDPPPDVTDGGGYVSIFDFPDTSPSGDYPEGWGPPPAGWPPKDGGGAKDPGGAVPSGDPQAGGKKTGPPPGGVMPVGPLKGGDKGFGGWKANPFGGLFGAGKKGGWHWLWPKPPKSHGHSLHDRAIGLDFRPPKRGPDGKPLRDKDGNIIREPGPAESKKGDLGLPGGIPPSAMQIAPRVVNPTTFSLAAQVPPAGAPTISTRSPGQYRPIVAMPLELAHGPISFRPQLQRPGAIDYRNWFDPDSVSIRKCDFETPTVARLEPYGAQGGTAGVGTLDGSMGQGDPWILNFQRGTRYPGGTASGGLMFMVPELSGTDRASAFAPAGVTLSTAFFTYCPGTYLALGLPDFKTGGIVSGHQASETSAILTFQRVSAAGVATSQFRLPTSGGPQVSLGGTQWASLVAEATASAVSQGTPAGVAETVLQAYSIPANTITAAGQAIRITAYGRTAANANGKTIRVYVGAVAVLATNDITGSPNGSRWSAQVKVITGPAAANTQSAIGQMMVGGVAQSPVFGNPNVDPTATIPVQVTGQNAIASANDIICDGLEVEAMA